MSCSGAESVRRSISSDISPGKRMVHNDEQSTTCERAKRLRRNGSSPQLGEQDSTVVSSRNEIEKSGSVPETDARIFTSPQPSSSFSSPLSSVTSHLVEKSEESIQKTVDVWQNSTRSTISELNDQELPGRTDKINEAQTTVSPGSPGGDGSRNWVSTDERPIRTPLPTQKEPGEQDPGSARGQDYSITADQISRTRQSFSSEVSEQPSNYSDDHLRAIAKDSIRLSVRDAPKWQAGGEDRQLPPLPSIGVSFHPAIGQNHTLRHLNQFPSQRGVNSFPAALSMLPSEEILRRQSFIAFGKQNGSRSPNLSDVQGRVEDKQISRIPSSGNALPSASTFRYAMANEALPPTSSPEFPKSNLQARMSRPGSAASNTPRIHHVVRPRHSTSPPLSVDRTTISQSPRVTFTIDNRAESHLQDLDIQPYMQEFTQNTAVILPLTAINKQPTSHPISLIMWQSLNELYQWYTQLLQIKEAGPLMFELIDVHWQDERSFVVPEGNLNYFRIMKQYVWDLYWLAVNINKGPAMFRVVVTRFTPPDQRSPRKPVGQWTSINTNSGGIPGRRIETEAQSHVIVKSRPGPLYAHQLSGPTIASNTITQNQSSTSPRLKLENTKKSQSKAKRESISSIQSMKDEENSQRQSLAPVSPPLTYTRTMRDQTMLRERAHAYLVNRPEMQLLPQESTVLDKLPYKTGSEVCGAIIDKQSGKGMVAITGKGYITLNIKTGPDEVGERYQEVTVQGKQTCMLHGGAVVLFYKRRQASPESNSSVQTSPRLDRAPGLSNGACETEILIRLQMDASGRFSPPFPKSVLRLRISTIEFFSFFEEQTGYRPEKLKFTFKDAMPVPRSTEVARGNEDHFGYMRKDVKNQVERAKSFMADLKEFVILVSVPGWDAGNERDEEEW